MRWGQEGNNRGDGRESGQRTKYAVNKVQRSTFKTIEYSEH